MSYQNETNLTPPQIHFLQALLDGKREFSELEAQIRQKSLKLHFVKLPVAVSCVAPYYTNIPFEKKDEVIAECSNYICRFLEKEKFQYCCLKNTYENFQIILPTEANGITGSDLDELFIRLHNKLSHHFNLDLFIGIGSAVEHYTEISRSASEAMEMLAYKFQYADRGVINITNTSRFKHYSVYGEDIMFARVIGCFQDGNIAAMSTRLNELVDSVRQRPGVSRTAIKRTIIELAVNILHIASNAEVDVDAVTGDLDIYTWVLQQNHTEVLTEWLLNLSGNLIGQMATKQAANEKEIITLASDYIVGHIGDPELCLQAVSDAVGLSSAYFSQLFKSEKGIGVSNFITDSRVAEAQRLLCETDMKSEDIALQLGFTSSTYFGRVFKKNTGMTPNTYRKHAAIVESGKK